MYEVIRMNEYSVGQNKKIKKEIEEKDLYLMAGVSGDLNPIHIDEEFAKKTMFEEKIAHGLTPICLIYKLLGNHLPGPGTILLNQELQYKSPVKIGDVITAKVEIIEINNERDRITLETICKNQEGETVLSGKAETLVSEVDN